MQMTQEIQAYTKVELIRQQIIPLPGRPAAMLAPDLAEIYETNTRMVHQAVRRNPERFPEPEFVFRPTLEEMAILRTQFEAAKFPRGELGSEKVLGYLAKARTPPALFTRMGANMLSAVLKSPVAAQRAVQIMRAFSKAEEAATGHVPPAPAWRSSDVVVMRKDARLAELERQVVQKDMLIDFMARSQRVTKKELTAPEMAEISRLFLAGVEEKAIARRLGRQEHTVRVWIRHAGLRQKAG